VEENPRGAVRMIARLGDLLTRDGRELPLSRRYAHA